METIFRSQVMDIINSGRPFDLDFVTADRRRGTGGDYISLKKHLKLRADMPPDALPAGMAKQFVSSGQDRQNHLHKTFVVFNPANRTAHPITVHWRLMQVINGKQIING